MSEPSPSLVDAKDSLAKRSPRLDVVDDSAHQTKLFIQLAAAHRRVFSRLLSVKTPVATFAQNSRAATNMPACIISCASAALRRKVDFPT